MLVIKNAKIYTSAGHVINRGDILMGDGKILAVGPDLTVPEDTRILDAEGMTAIPGIIDAHTHAGCRESLTGSDHDANEISSPINLDLDVYYSIDSESSAFADARKNGVTTLTVLPGSAIVIGGMCCTLKTRCGTVAEMCFQRQDAVKASLGGGPRSVFGKRGMAPTTMMGQMQLLREELKKAEKYRQKKELAGGSLSGCAEFDQGMENLCRVLNREIPLRVHVEAHNILNVIRLAEEFDIPFVLEHAFGFKYFLEEIAETPNLVGVVLGPTFYPSLPGIAQETSIAQAMELVERGICVSIMTDFFPETNFGTLMLQAGEITRAGADVEAVLEMLTINAAKILGIDNRVGSIEEGKDADIVLFDGVPLEDTGANVKYTFIDGEVVYASI